MKLHQIALAVATLAAAGQAAALDQAAIAAARAGGTLKEVWVSGASAVTRNAFEAFKADCTDPVHIYTNDAAGTVPGSAGDFMAYACTTNTLGPTVAYHTVAGGSFNAFAPHVVGAQLERVKQADIASCAAPVVGGTGDTVYRSCTKVNPVVTADLAPALPDGGFSDVDSPLFQDLFTTAPASVGTEASANVFQVFGVAVSTNLYRAMQQVQGKNSATCTDDTYVTATKTYTQNGLHDFRDPACMPSITKAQYTSIAALGGGYQSNWEPLLGVGYVDGNGTAAASAVNLCRRVPTSGTQASSNAYFLRSPCNRGTAGGELLPASTVDSTAASATAASGIWITESSGTSDVKKCLNKANDNATRYFAIGVVSAENNPFGETLTDRDDYRFVMLDGVSPENVGDDRARQNAIDSKYGFAMELSAFTANSASVDGAAMLATMTAGMGTVGGADLRGLYISPAGGADHNANPNIVGKGTRFGNNCQSINMFF